MQNFKLEHYTGRRAVCKPSSGRRLSGVVEELPGERRGCALGVLSPPPASSGAASLGLNMVPVPGIAPGATTESHVPFSLDATERILFALAQAVEQRDHQTAGHCERLAFMAVAMGLAMGLERVQLLSLYRGGYLHDLGKVGIPDSILFKPDKLTASEWVIMRSHTTRGEEICRPLASLQSVLPIIRHHHERLDGSGYPDGLSGNQIPLLARIVQVADIYDALVNTRPYKSAFDPKEALQVLRAETEKGWRDPHIVGVFVRLHEKVITRIGEYAGDADRSLESLRAALVGLDPLA